jgi:hypothetical protein
MLPTIAITLLLALQGHSVEDAAWLTGCWKTTVGTRAVTELWLPPDGGTMIGLSRTVSRGKTVEYEFIVLRSGTRGLEYVAKPSGQPEAVFTATTVSRDELILENPQHDFPTRIGYRRTREGLTATVSGAVAGKPRSVEFKYVAGDCSR